ncbi:MAG: arginine N-succinyltransferase [Gammaproteobacteria bacterium]|nr:arginine N-succinyltransferase [Gammaproteobacteria bacterium]NND54517.1 arginine N-succinyltransferase [Gammaproteobacteria bacterium]
MTEQAQRKGFSGLQVTAIVLLAIVVTVFVGWWVIRTYIFPSELEPVELTYSEQVELGNKLKAIGVVRDLPAPPEGETARATPEPYSEAGASRALFFSEREMNGLIAEDSELANNLAIDLSDDLVSFTLLIPVPQDFPVMPGRIVRVRGGAEVAFANGRPVVAIKGVSLMGVPVPNAWLGNLKNVDLVQQYGDAGFWKAFAAGVESVNVENGRIQVQLRE